MVEFAMVAPVLIMALLGLFDMSYNIYAASMVEGAIHKAARDSTIEGSDLAQAQIDGRVTDAVRAVVPSAELSFDRRAYSDFQDVGEAEDFTDSNQDGVCNDGEPFEDANGNKIWDLDRGTGGFGGARDAVLYTVSVTYKRQFPLHTFTGLPDEVTTTARTLLRNQPYAMQQTDASVEFCK
ncbi:pilus assembly protein [Alteraurantiacibacter aquimixticola]|uniref:Pilus assembly protein n=2 Tax=Alteraurantiacibacter aquimixticola TaxID=2489173 RepID=A0A4T3F111_9SPHN|nr:pilus assembly protein [Alteraurantiacibacter aquimixticola]